MTLYIIPPLVTIYLWFCFSVISIIKGKSDPVKYYFPPLTFIWSLTAFASIAHIIVINTKQDPLVGIEIVEQITHALYAQGPFIHLWVFYNVLGVRINKYLYNTVFVTGTLFSCLAFTPDYLSGVTAYSWGYICKGNYLMVLFVIFSLLVVSYIIRLFVVNIKNETNDIRRQKTTYLFIGFIFAALLTLTNLAPIFGVDFFPLANFAFIPVAIFGYGIFNYRILDLSEMANTFLLWIVLCFILIVPNFLVFSALYSFLHSVGNIYSFIVFGLWFYINYRFIHFIVPVVKSVFNRQPYGYKKIETQFIENILFLKKIDDLSDIFHELFIGSLGFRTVDFYTSSGNEHEFVSSDGKQINLEVEAIRWFVSHNHLVDYYMVSTNPYYEPIRNSLIRLMSVNSSYYLVPIVYNKRMTGIIFLGEKVKNQKLCSREVNAINNIREFSSIAILNSYLFQNVSVLKDKLETKTALLEQEIVERKKTQEFLVESEARYRLLADNVFDAIWVIELSTFQFTYFSPSIEKQLGYTPNELEGTNVARLLTGRSYNDVSVAVKRAFSHHLTTDQRSLIIELEALHKNGQTVWVEISAHFMLNDQGTPVSIIGVSRDITERKRAESERRYLENKLMQAQKMESIGALAGGIAHDFNNILMAILGYTQLVGLYITKQEYDKAGQKIDEVEKACNRARELVSRILTFSRQSEQKKSRINIQAVVDEALGLIEVSLPSTVEIEKQYDSAKTRILADAVQVHQIILNLCTNAYHAMQESGGKITVSIKTLEIDSFKASELYIKPGLFCLLSVEDNGHGINEENVKRIFDPYFTTKDVGRGTGMGLSVVHGIVLKHNGAIAVESKPSEGTRFCVYLPIGPDTTNGESPALPPEGEEDNSQYTILFVDDEEMLCELAQESLGESGYHVDTVSHAPKALALFQKNPHKYDVVITDLTMPEITGDILISKIKAIRKDIKTILCTGYNYNLSDKMRKAIQVDMYLVKPLTIRDIDSAVREILK